MRSEVIHVPELAKMTAKISSTSHQIIYEGTKSRLHGAAVRATDLRAEGIWLLLV